MSRFELGRTRQQLHDREHSIMPMGIKQTFIILSGLCLTSSALWSTSSLAVAAEANAVAKSDKAEGVLLGIGSTAPPLDIEHWFSDGNGRLPPVKEFEPGKVYVVEFWATWCGPCVASMPHLAKLQQQYAGRDLQIISSTEETSQEVKSFLKRPFTPGSDGHSKGKVESDTEPSTKSDTVPSTYAELTSVYCLTADPDSSVYEDYMIASGHDMIPMAYLVGKTGKIEWIGMPMSLDEPLEGVMNDTWDRDVFRKTYLHEREVSSTVSKLFKTMNKANPDELLATIKKTIDGCEGISDLDSYVEQLNSIRQAVLVRKLKNMVSAGKVEEARAIAKTGDLRSSWQDRFEDSIFANAMKNGDYDEALQLFDSYVNENPRDWIRKRILITMIVNQWDSKGELPPQILDAGVRVAKQSMKQRAKGGTNAFLLARLQRANGDLTGALESANKALPEMKKNSSLARAVSKFINEIESETTVETE